MTEGVARGVLGNPGAADRVLQRALEDGFLEVMTATPASETLEEDVPLDPMDVRLLGAMAVVSGADGLPDLLEKSRLWGAGWPGFTGSESRREGARGQEGIGDLTVRPNGDSHAGSAPTFVRPKIAE
jgi:hypothetical protein